MNKWRFKAAVINKKSIKPRTAFLSPISELEGLGQVSERERKTGLQLS